MVEKGCLNFRELCSSMTKGKQCYWVEFNSDGITVIDARRMEYVENGYKHYPKDKIPYIYDNYWRARAYYLKEQAKK